MDTSIISAFESTFTQLDQLCEQLGTDSEQAKAALGDKIKQHLSDAVQTHQSRIDELRGDVATAQATLDGLNTSLYGSQGSSEVYEQAPNEGLIQFHARVHDALQQLEATKNERTEELQFLLDELNAGWDDLEWQDRQGFQTVGQDLTQSTFDAVQEKLQELAQESTDRKNNLKSMFLQITALWSELKVTPETEFEQQLMSKRMDIGIAASTMENAKATLEKLITLKTARETQVRNFAVAITKLWDRLHIDEDHRESFFSNQIGLGQQVIESCKQELEEMQQLRQENIQRLVQEAREKLSDLWDAMHLADQQRDQFQPFQSTDFTEELLSAHEAEIELAKERLVDMQPVLKLVNKREEMRNQAKDFKKQSSDPKRLLSKKSDSGRLLREEKMRKMIKKDLPKLEAKLISECKAWEERYGEPFLFSGVPFIDFMELQTQKEAEEEAMEKKRREEEKRRQIEEEMYPGSSSRRSAKTPAKTPAKSMRRTAKTPKTRGNSKGTVRSAPNESMRQLVSPMITKGSMGSKTPRKRKALSKDLFDRQDDQDAENRVENWVSSQNQSFVTEDIQLEE